MRCPTSARARAPCLSSLREWFACAASGPIAQGARGAFKNAVPAGTWALFESVYRQRMSSEIGGQVSAGGAEMLGSGIAGGHNHRLGWCPHRVGYCLRVP